MVIIAIVAGVLLGAVGIYLLYIAAQGQLPAALNLLNMEQWSNRIVLIVVLLALLAVLIFAYRSAVKKNGQGRSER